MNDVELKNNITEMLMSLKISPAIYGFDYIRKAVEFCKKDSKLIYNITSQLYPKVAQFYNVKPSIVERCIRKVITISYENGGLLGINEIYNMVIYTNNYKLTNGELISMLTEKLRLMELREEYEYKRTSNDGED